MTFVWAIAVWYLIFAFCRAYGFMLDQKFVSTNVIKNVHWKIQFEIVFAEYDQWIGCYIDRKNKVAYWFAIPFIGLKLYLKEFQKEL